MAPSRDDVHAMVVALFTMNAGLDRSRRQSQEAGTLRLLQTIADAEGTRPSEIAEQLRVHPSLITRQLRELADAGHVHITGNPADRRSYLVVLTPAGVAELHRLTKIGLDRFASFVADWEPGEVRMLTGLLEKLEAAKAAVGARERQSATRRRN